MIRSYTGVGLLYMYIKREESAPTMERTTKSKRLRRYKELLHQLQKHLCFWCGEPMNLKTPNKNKRAATLDHLTPQCRGGRDEWNNLVACCRDCNVERSCKDFSETVHWLAKR